MASGDKIYPDPHPETTSCDGHASYTPNPDTWSKTRTHAGSSFDDSGTLAVAQITSDASSSGYYYNMRRTVFIFDTSGIPAGATITSATVGLKLWDKENTLAWSDARAGMALVKYTGAETTVLSAASYNIAKYGARIATDIGYSTLSAGSYNVFTLTDLTVINKGAGALTKIGMRIGADVDNDPGTWAASKNITLNIYTAETALLTSDPYLIVNYTTGTSAISGQTTGTATQIGAIQGAGVFVGSSQGVGTSVSNLLGAGDLSGSLSCAATSSGALIGFIPAIGQTTGISSYSADLLGAGDFTASSYGVTTTQGILLGDLSLVGESNGLASFQAVMFGSGTLAAGATGLATPEGLLSGTGLLIGSSSGETTSEGILLNIGGAIPAWMIGEVTGTADLTGSLIGYIPVAGEIIGLASLAGTLTGKAFVVSDSHGISILTGDLVGSGSLSGKTFGQIISHAWASGLIGGDGCSYGTSIAVSKLMRVRFYDSPKLSRTRIIRAGIPRTGINDNYLSKTGLASRR